MSNIFFTSDTHYGHANIASPHSSRWKRGFRDFKSLEEMNQDLVKQINKIIKPDDTLWHLGDWSFGGVENIWKFRKQVLCDNIHLILGNHDHHIEENKELIIPLEDREYCFHRFGKFSTIHAQSLFKSVQHYKELKVSGKIIVLSHYSFRVWHGSHKDWLHFYAHSHDSLPPYGKSHDVGIDTAKRLTGDYRPFFAGEIVNFVDKLPTEFPDHHDLNTNTGKPQGAKRG